MNNFKSQINEMFKLCFSESRNSTNLGLIYMSKSFMDKHVNHHLFPPLLFLFALANKCILQNVIK